MDKVQKIRNHYNSKNTDNPIEAMDYIIDGKPISYEVYKEMILSQIERHLTFNRDDVVFDVGCGAGLIVSEIENKVKSIEGIDISSRLLSFYKGKSNLYCSSIDQYKFKNNFYTKIFMFSVSIHFPDVEYFKNVIKKLSEALAPGGVLLIGDQIIKEFYHTDKYFCLKLSDLANILEELKLHFSIIAQSEEFRYRNRYDILIYK